MIEIIRNNLTKGGNLKASFFQEHGTTGEECYIIHHHIDEKPKCPVCGSDSSFRSFKYGYNKYCSSKCCNTGKWTPENKEQGNKKRALFYDNNPQKKQEKDEKISKTNSEVWASGTDLRVNQTQKVKDGVGFAEIYKKGRKTKIEKHGHAFDIGSDYFKNIMIEKYGVDNARRIEGMTARLQETFLETYGVKNSISILGVREKSLETRRKNYLEKIENLDNLERYITLVWHETKKNNLTILENFDKRGRIDINQDAYHLDHRYSICAGYLNNVPPEIIGNIANLEMLPAIINIKKGSNCSISLDDLLQVFYKNV